MRIGILETGHVHPDIKDAHGTYAHMFAELLDGYGFEFTNYAVVDQELPKSVNDEEGWIITGSKHGVYEDHPWVKPLEQFIRDAYGADVPMIGICFGHQIMAQALGGKVEKFSGGWAVGPTDYTFNDGEQLSLIAIHQDQVVVAPPDVEVIASNDFCKFAGFAYKGKALSYQPHPEFTPEFTADLIKIRYGTVFPVDIAQDALDSIDLPLQSKEIAAEMAKFLLENQTARAEVA